MGGNLGLFIGVSIISLFEMLDFFIDVCLILASPSFYDKTHKQQEQNNNKISENKLKKVFIVSERVDYLPSKGETNSGTR